MNEMYRWILLMVIVGGLVLSACGSKYEADDDTADDDDTGDDDTGDDDTNTLDDPSISAVTPSTGDLFGGYAVNIYGANFTTTEDTEIYFDDVLTNLQGCGPAQCTILAPQWDEEEAVTVRMVNSGGEAVLEDGFYYVADMSGLTSYFASLTRYEYLYPEIYSTPPDNEVRAHAGFFDPINEDILVDLYWGGLLPDTGECEIVNVEDDWDTFSVSAMHAGDSITLVGPSNELVLEKDPGIMGWEYRLEGLDIYTDWEAGDYTLQIPGGDDLGPEEVANAITCPGTVTLNHTFTADYVYLSDFQSGMQIDVTGDCDGVVVRVDMLDNTGGQYLEYDSTILCHFAGSGAVQIDPAAASQFSATAVGIVAVDCYDMNTTIIASGAAMTGLGRVYASGVIQFM